MFNTNYSHVSACVCLKEPTAVGHLEAKAMPVLKTAVEMSSHLKHI